MSNEQPVVIIDPGHGGITKAGGSSANNTTSATGLLEKDVVLQLARHVRELLAGEARVLLTRDADENLTLADRAAVARANRADVFVSLHLDASPDPADDHTDVYAARTGNPERLRLSELLHRRLAAATGTSTGTVRGADLGVLLPDRHNPATAACLAEIACLTNPEQARRLSDDRYRRQVAESIAASVREYLRQPVGANGHAPAAGAAVAASSEAAPLPAQGPRVLSVRQAVGLSAKIDRRVDQVLDHVRAEARRSAQRVRTVDLGSAFLRALRDRYLAGYLAAPSTATATAALEAIGRQNTSGVVTQVCGEPDYWEAATPAFNGGPVPGLLRSLSGLGGLPATFGAATEVLTVANRRLLPFIDVPFLVGRRTLDVLDCATRRDRARDPDLQAGNGINESQLMHWATGVRYASLGDDLLRALFLAYELWHLEYWDVFGHDPINDLIAEDAGRHLAGEVAALRVDTGNLIAVLDAGFRQARAWVGAILRIRRAELERQIGLDPPPSAWLHWNQEVVPDSPDHPYPNPSVRALLTLGTSVDMVKASDLVARYVEVYTLMEEADAWERANGPIPVTALQRGIVEGAFDAVFRAAAAAEAHPPSISGGSLSLRRSVRRGGGPLATAMTGGVGPGAVIGAGWEVVRYLTDSRGDVSWQLQQMDGVKSPRDETARFQHATQYQELKFVVRQGLTTEGIFGALKGTIAADFPVLFKCNGHSVGPVTINEPMEPKDTLGWRLHVTASIVPDPQAWTVGGRDPVAAVDVTFHYRFHSAGEEFIPGSWYDTRTYVERVKIFGTGDVQRIGETNWPLDVEPPNQPVAATPSPAPQAASQSVVYGPPRALALSIPASPAAPPPALDAWAGLVSFRPPEAVQRSLHGVVDWDVHRIEDAWGPVNLDHYPVHITALPAGVTQQALVETVRGNLNAFVDPTICTFEGYDSGHTARWRSASPVGAVVHIDMMSMVGGQVVNVEDGSVVCAEASPEHWVFSTIWTTGDFGHPVSGNRWFGLTAGDDGAMVFSTRGADRLTSLVDMGSEWQTGAVFDAAHRLWISLQQCVAAWVNANGGTATVGHPVSARYNWDDILRHYYRPTVPWL